MAANRKKGTSLLAGLENLVEKPAEEKTLVESTPVIQTQEPERVLETIIPTEPSESLKEETHTESKKNIVKEKNFGRPRKFAADEETKVLGIRVRLNEARFLEKYGGQYGGKTGYVTYLIRKEMERLGVDF